MPWLYTPERPLIHPAYGWDRLTGLRNISLSARLRRQRLRRVLQELEGRDLVSFPEGANRYDNFRLLTDDDGTKRYRVPASTDPSPIIAVPATLVTNGWHLVLTPPEIAVLLMLFDTARRFPGAHAGDGVSVAPSTRWASYGAPPEVYSAHNELWEFGLLERHGSVPERRRGRVKPPAAGDDPFPCFEFKLKPTTLELPAYDVVHEALKRPVSRHASWPRPVDLGAVATDT